MNRPHRLARNITAAEQYEIRRSDIEDRVYDELIELKPNDPREVADAIYDAMDTVASDLRSQGYDPIEPDEQDVKFWITELWQGISGQ